ncbi:phosphotriesterase [Neobacillus niacini]|uniref:phosphotriesterase family protein n=1 Tax=Neobacillus niacini TaxID=86668 RepID=UPI00300119C9
MISNSVEKSSGIVQTVLGPVQVQELGVVLIREAILSVVPGAELAPEINIDENIIFEKLRCILNEYRQLGGRSIVDCGGMYQGRNLPLYRLLSKETGVHIVASTGLGAEPTVGAYFTTPPTMMLNPPRPLPVAYLADLFAKEVTEGIAVPRRERSGPAGIISIGASREGVTLFERQVYLAAARAALQTGASVSIQVGADVFNELDILESEGLPPSRVIVGGLDRINNDSKNKIVSVARRGAMITLDHSGWSQKEGYMSDLKRAELVLELCEKGLGEHVLVSSNSVGCAFGHEVPLVGFGHVLSTFIPILRQAGGTEDHVHILLEDNPQRLLAFDQVNVVETKS